MTLIAFVFFLAALPQQHAEASETQPRLPEAPAANTRETATYRRIKAHLDSVPAIDTHDHLWPFDRLPGYVETEHGKGMNLYSLWRNSYYSWNHSLTPWKAGG